MRTPFDQRLTVLLAGLAACEADLEDPFFDPEAVYDTDDIRSLENADWLVQCVTNPGAVKRERFDHELVETTWGMERAGTLPCMTTVSAQASWLEPPVVESECGIEGRYLCLIDGPILRTEDGEPVADPMTSTAASQDVEARCYYPALRTGTEWVCGRPLRDTDGMGVLAPLQGREDWMASSVIAGLTPNLRRALAARWLQDAQAEHASIASFAQLTLDLLAHGAPAHLIARAAQAQADEVRHARTAFGIASALLGEAVGPGPMALPCLPTPTLAELAAATVRDGCVGESFAAAEASLRLANTRMPTLRAALAVVAQDEAQHALLARDIVAWAEAVGGPSVQSAVREAWITALHAPVSFFEEPTAPHVGLCGTVAIERARREVLERVVAPELGSFAA